MNASTDLAARQVFLDDLRNRVALRSVMHPDDIHDVDIVEAVDADVVATRELLRVVPLQRSASPSTDATGEIDACDVLEAIDILLPSPAVAMPAAAMPAAAMPPPYVPYLAVDPFEQSYDEDAFYANGDAPSTGPVTYPLGDSVTEQQSAQVPQRRLGWVVATVLACAAALVVSAAVTDHVRSAPIAESARSTIGSMGSPPRTAAAPSPPTETTPWVVTMDVKNLPPALVGTIVAPAHRALFVDEQRVQGPSAVVACGTHVIRTGLSKKTRTVDVPCGGKLAVY